MADVTAMLSRVPLFSGVKPKELKKLARQLSEQNFSEGHVIATEGQSGVGFFLIQTGNVTVSRDGETIRTLGPGEWFGEIALIDQGPRSATVTAATDLKCIGMSAWEFRPFVQNHPEVAWPLLEALVGRLRDSEARGPGA
jgi:CRP/FNR family cyclic AMP-dependent transcriptional regulator